MADDARSMDAATLLSVDEVGLRLHLHPQTVRRLMNRGELPFVKLGRYRMVAPDDLVAFIASRRVEPNGDGDHH